MVSASNPKNEVTSHSANRCISSSKPSQVQQRHEYVSFAELGAPFDIPLAEPSSPLSERESSKTGKELSRPRKSLGAKLRSFWPKISGLLVPQKECSTNATATANEDEHTLQPTNNVSSNTALMDPLSNSMKTSKNAFVLRKETRVRFWLFSHVKTSIVYTVSARSDADEYAEVAEFVYSGGKYKKKPGILGKTCKSLKKLARALS